MFPDRYHAARYLDKVYDAITGIYNHSGNVDDQLKTHAYTPSDDIDSGSLRETYIENYRDHDINGLFNISLLEFMSLTSDMANELLRLAEPYVKLKKEKMNELNELLKGKEK